MVSAYDVSGTVTKAGSEEVVIGATVTIGGKSATTDENGAYTVSGLLPGEHTGTVIKEGYKSGRIDSFTIDDGYILAGNLRQGD